MRERGELLEWAEVHGNLYGTPRAPVEAALAEGRDVLFDIDWQGTRQLAEAMPDDVVRIFVLPPSMAELKRAARAAGGGRSRRSSPGASPMPAPRSSTGSEYEYVIVNDDLQRSLGIARTILAAERQKRIRQPELEEFVARLLGGA